MERFIFGSVHNKPKSTQLCTGVCVKKINTMWKEWIYVDRVRTTSLLKIHKDIECRAGG